MYNWGGIPLLRSPLPYCTLFKGVPPHCTLFLFTLNHCWARSYFVFLVKTKNIENHWNPWHNFMFMSNTIKNVQWGGTLPFTRGWGILWSTILVPLGVPNLHCTLGGPPPLRAGWFGGWKLHATTRKTVRLQAIFQPSFFWGRSWGSLLVSL